MADIAIYEGAGRQTEVRLDRENIWLAQAQMVDLFGRDQSVIPRHVRNVFGDGELDPESNMQKMHIAGSDEPVALSGEPEGREAGRRPVSGVFEKERSGASARSTSRS